MFYLPVRHDELPQVCLQGKCIGARLGLDVEEGDVVTAGVSDGAGVDIGGAGGA